MTFPRTIRLSTDGNVVIAINPVNQGDIIAGLTARERILLGHKMVIERMQAIKMFLQNGILAGLVGQLFDQRISPYFKRLASHREDASTWCQALAELR